MLLKLLLFYILLKNNSLITEDLVKKPKNLISLINKLITLQDKLNKINIIDSINHLFIILFYLKNLNISIYHIIYFQKNNLI